MSLMKFWVTCKGRWLRQVRWPGLNLCAEVSKGELWDERLEVGYRSFFSFSFVLFFFSFLFKSPVIPSLPSPTSPIGCGSLSLGQKVLTQTLRSHGDFWARGVWKMLLNFVPVFSDHLIQLVFKMFLSVLKHDILYHKQIYHKQATPSRAEIHRQFLYV